MAKNTEIPVSDWLKIRTAVAGVLRSKTTSTATSAMAEALLTRGWIDVDAVRADTTPPKEAPDDVDPFPLAG